MIEMTQKISTPLTMINFFCVVSERNAFPVFHMRATELEDKPGIRIQLY